MSANDGPLRIGIDIRVADPGSPGQQRYLWRLGGWLATQGHDVHYLTLRRQPDEVRTPPGTHLHRLDDRNTKGLGEAVKALLLDVLMLNPERSRRYRRLRANLLRSAYGTEHYVQKLRSFRSPLERSGRALLRLNPWDAAERRWERAFYEDADPPPDVLAQSAYMRGQILGSYEIPDDRVHIVHNAVDTTEYSVAARLQLRERMRARWSIPADAFCVLFLAHNFRLKGLWDIFAALAAEGAPRDVRLLVVGRGTGRRQRAKARRLVDSLGLEGRVILAGPVHPSLHAHAAADALLHLSWHDSFGFVALEAMACGLPVVTTRFAGASELIEDGVSGLLVDPGDPAAIGASILRLRDRSWREELGARAAAVGAVHDEASNFARVEEIMRKAARRWNRPIGR